MDQSGSKRIKYFAESTRIRTLFGPSFLSHPVFLCERMWEDFRMHSLKPDGMAKKKKRKKKKQKKRHWALAHGVGKIHRCGCAYKASGPKHRMWSRHPMKLKFFETSGRFLAKCTSSLWMTSILSCWCKWSKIWPISKYQQNGTWHVDVL